MKNTIKFLFALSVMAIGFSAKLSAQCNIITTIAGSSSAGSSGDGGAATAAALNGPNWITSDAAGNYYVCDGNNHKIRKISTSGIISTIAGTGSAGFSGDGGPATAAQLNQPSSIVFDVVGNLYIGDLNNNRIRKINTSGIISTFAGTGTASYTGDGGPATAATFNLAYGVVFDPAGNLYITDEYNHAVRKINTSGIISTVAGTGTAGYSGDGGAATAATLRYPNGITSDRLGNIYVMDNSNHRIRKIATTGIITTVAGNGTGGFTGDGGAATAAEINFGAGIVTDYSGNLYFADASNNRIRVVNASGIISTFAGTGTAGFSGDGGAATAAQINSALGVAFDNVNNILIADCNNNRVRKILTGAPIVGALSGPSSVAIGSTITLTDTTSGGTWNTNSASIASVNTSGTVTGVAAGSTIISYSVTGSCGPTIVTHPVTVTSSSSSCAIITTIAGTGSAGSSGDGSAATAATMNIPQAIALDRYGNIYFADYGNNKIRKINTSTGIISTIAGTGSAGSSGDGGAATAATLNNPVGLAIDTSGNIYIADHLNNKVRRINTSGIISTFAGTGSGSFGGDGGAATAASLFKPYCVYLDNSGNVFIADRGNRRVRKVNSSGVISTIAGTGSTGYSGDGGAATAATFALPTGITMDPSGNMYIADDSNFCVRKINTSGIISTFAGTGSLGFSGDGGAATAATLWNPYNVASDASGNIYICDQFNSRIREVNTSGIISTFAGNGSASSSGDGGSATAASINHPFFITVNGSDFYISDQGGNRIRKIITGPPSVSSISGASTVATGNTIALTDSTAGGSWSSSSVSIASVSTSGVVTGIAAGSATISYSITNGCGTTVVTHAVTVTTSCSIITTVAGTGTASYSGDGGAATAATLSNPQYLGTDASCNYYIGDWNNHRIRKVTPAGIITTFAGTGSATYSGDGGAATAAGLSGAGAMIFDAAGNFYFSDVSNHRVRKISTSGIITTIAGTGSAGHSGDGGAATAAAFNNPYGLAFDAAGNLIVADQYNHCIRKISTSGIVTNFAGTGTSGYSGDGGAASSATFYFPQCLYFSAAGELYVNDNSNHRLRKINASGIVSTFAGTGTVGFSGDGGPATAAQINWFGGLDMDGSGNLYIADCQNNRIRKVNTSGIISTIAGTGTAGHTGDGGPATAATFNNCNDVKLDCNGNFLVCELNNNCVRKIATGPPVVAAISGPSSVATGSTITLTDTTSGGTWSSGSISIASVSTSGVVTGIGVGSTTISYSVTNGCGTTVVTHAVTVTSSCNIITTIAGTGAATSTGNGGAATAASVNAPSGVAFDASGNIYISEAHGHYIRKISTSGVISIFAGTGTAGHTGDGGPATAAQINNPLKITFDRSGNLYFPEYGSNTVRKISPSGIITTVAGTGTAGFGGDGGAATAAQLSYPSGISFDTSGNFYIADYVNYRIRKVTPAGIITTVAGNGSAGYSGDGGAATAASINGAFGVGSDPAGNFYIADASNNRVRKVSTSGIITTFAGTGTAGYSGDGGSASAANLDNPAGVMVDRSGNIVIADQVNNRIRVVNSSGIINTIAGNGTLGFAGDGGAATAAEINHSNEMQYDATGNLYICDNDNNRVRKVSPGTITVSAISGPSSVAVGSTITLTDTTAGGTWSSGGPFNATVSSGGVVTGVALGAALISYSVTNTCGTTVATYLVTITSSACARIITTVAGNGAATYSGDGGAATAGSINLPTCVRTDLRGNLYIADASNNRIRKVSTSGVITTIAGNGSAGYSGDGGAASAASLNGPFSIAFDTSGNMYISDLNNARIRKVNTSGIITTIAGTGTAGSGGDGGLATAAQCQPYGIATDKFGNIFFASGAKVRKINTSGIISTYAGNGTSGYCCDGTPATNAMINTVQYITTDTTGNLYLSDAGNNRIRIVNTSGTIATIAGTGSSGFSGDGGPASAATFNTPAGLKFDALGNLYVADNNNNRLRMISSTGRIISTLSGQTLNGFTGDGGPATAAELNHPADVALDTFGNIYVADMNNDRIRKIYTVGPTLSTISGASSVCTSRSITLTDTSAGGTWSSSAASIGTISSSGVLTGVTTGIVIISYAKTNTCGTTIVTKTDTVNGSPYVASISGSSSVCLGTPLTLTDSTSGGTWSITNGTIATVLSSGLVYGISTGIDTVKYTVSNTCGSATSIKVISILPNSGGTISGAGTVCVGGTTTYSTTASGGTWSMQHPSIATINPSTGTLTGLTTGNDSVYYTVVNSCGTFKSGYSITVITTPTLSAISGPSSVCVGANITESDSTSGGTWSSSNIAVASITSGGTLRGNSVGTTTITYSVTNSCGTSTVTKTITVTTSNAGAISGPNTVCPGATITLSDTASGGSWSSSNTSIASVTSGGIVRGNATGTVTITYLVSGSCGSAITTYSVTVSSGTSAGTISGADSVCLGATTTLTDGVSGGVWSSSDVTIASVNSSTGAVTGIASGSAVITYTTSGTCGSAIATHAIFVKPGVSAGTISGTTTACVGATTTLTDIVTGGTWSSSNNAVASVTAGGVVRGNSAGTATISYTVVSSCGSASATTTVSITASPTAGTISGPSSVCTGATITLTDAVTGGTWSTSNASVASVNTSGAVTGVTVGTVTISYTVTTSCGTAVATTNITVNGGSAVSAITGASSLCPGTSITLADATTGGTWSSSNTARATVSTTGVVTGVAAGAVTISYTVSGICGATSATTTIAVNAAPSAGTISGTTSICTGTTTTLTDAVGGGTWSSSNNAIASVTAGGVVRGNSAGTATISYSITTSCGTAAATATVTVTNTTTAGTISGPGIVCTGTNITLSDAVTGGVWSSSNTAVASINTSGVVTGITTGTATISYTVTNSCGTATTTQSITVNPTASAGTISGTTTVCTGTSTTLTDAVGGGTWTSSNTAVASVNAATGVVTGVAAGTATVSYTVTNSCGSVSATTSITVNAAPTAGSITGSSIVCPGSSSTLADGVAGGVWSSSNTSIATVSTTGAVTGVAVGSATISYTVTTSCGAASATINMTVLSTPSAGTITGSTTICTGGTSTLADAVSGGVWSSSTASVASVSSAGVVTGIAAGTATISYRVTNSCGSATTTAIVTVTTGTSVAAITGTGTVCAGATTTLADATAGGSWSSSNPTIASVTSAGVVRGNAAGTCIITYSVSGSCGSGSATINITVNSTPSVAAIAGTTTVCTGMTTTLTDATAGGTWSSSNTSIASVSSTTGVVRGIAAGTATISYSVTNSCGTTSSTATVTVNSAPSAGTISGSATACTGTTTTYTSTVGSGTWSSSNTTVASVNSATGIISAIAAGTATITYSVTTSCGTATSTKVITVSTAPTVAAIAGTTTVCIGASTSFTDATSGGVWSSSNTSIASISSAGVVTGVATGTATISYTITASCGPISRTATITVNASTTAGTINGTTAVCAGATTTLTDAVTGGTWSSSNTAVASVDPTTGVVTGIAAGTATITYSVTGGCGTAVATAIVTVNPGASAGTISGTTAICVGSSVALTDAVAGGVWSSSNTAVASVTTGGIVRGNAGGTATISYTVTNSCGSSTATATVTISTAATAGTISGATTMCSGTTTTLTSTGTGGTWSSSNVSIATIGATTGVVTGLGTGSATITYSVSGGSCGAAIAVHTITVNPSPAAGTISGTTVICTGTTSTLTTTGTGGTWSSSNAAIASVNATGVVRGNAIGAASISYSVTNSCGTATAVAPVTVVTGSGAGTLSGAATLCTGATTVITGTVGGGTWSSSNAGIASVNTSGTVTAIAAGTVTITYTVASTCGTATATKTLTISAAASAGTISGAMAICVGSATTLSDAASGGTWTTSNAAIASVSASGIVTGIGGGTAVITYTVTNSCGAATATASVTVSTSASAGTLSGTTTICPSSPSTLTSTVAGGTWVTSNATIASVSNTGVVTGISGGNAVITYTVTNGCGTASTTATVNIAVAGNISGAATVCVGGSTTFTDPASGGTWSSNNNTIATISTSGVVGGVAAGTTTISYIMVNSCGTTIKTTTITVNPAASAGTITGASTLVRGTSITLTDATAGGTWSSSSAATATVNAAGVVTGVAAGTATITYSVSNSCGTAVATKSLSVTLTKDGDVQPAIPQIEVNIYPNPSNSIVHIATDVKVNVVVMTSTGRVVVDQKDATEIDLSSFADGMYMIMVYDAADNNLLKAAKLMKIE